MVKVSLQEQFEPTNECFGCGTANQHGLRLRSFVDGDLVVAEWRSRPEHQAFPGILCGGVISMLLDCHSDWTAIWAVMTRTGAAEPPMMVTDEYSVKFLRPAPLETAIRIVGRPVHVADRRAIIDASVERDGTVYAVSRGTFVVKQRPETPRRSS